MSTIEVGQIFTKINSASGVKVLHECYNAGEKEIKYITFTYIPYNAVNDVVSSTTNGQIEASGRLTGPVPAKSKTYIGWENMWYNPTITRAILTQVHIQFMDNTEEVIEGEDVISTEDETSAYYNEVEKHRGPLGEALQNLGKAAKSRDAILKRNSLTDTEEEYIKREVKFTLDEYIHETVGESADEYAIKTLPTIPDVKPTVYTVKKPTSDKLLLSFGILLALIVAFVLMFTHVPGGSEFFSTATGMVMIAAIVCFFITKSQYKEWKSEKDKYLADQRQVEENIKFNKNRLKLIAERDAKLPSVLEEYPRKVDAARNEYYEKVDAARAEYKEKWQAIVSTIATYDEEIETNLEIVESRGYLFPKEYYQFAEYLGLEILLEHSDNVLEAVDRMFEEHPDWGILLE